MRFFYKLKFCLLSTFFAGFSALGCSADLVDISMTWNKEKILRALHDDSVHTCQKCLDKSLSAMCRTLDPLNLYPAYSWDQEISYNEFKKSLPEGFKFDDYDTIYNCIELLLQAGANPNGYDKYDEGYHNGAPLLCVISSVIANADSVLCDDPNIPNGFCDTCLFTEFALYVGTLPPLMYYYFCWVPLLSKKKKNALEGICKVLGLLLDYGANPSGTLVDLEDEGMISPLYFACCLNEPKIVAYLIDSGAKVNDFNDSLVELCRGEEGIFDYREKCSPSLFFTNMSLKNMITYAHDAQKEYLEEYDGIVDSYFAKRVSKSFEVAEQSCRAIIKLLVDNGAQDFPPDLKKGFEWDPWDYYK